MIEWWWLAVEAAFFLGFMVSVRSNGERRPWPSQSQGLCELVVRPEATRRSSHGDAGIIDTLDNPDKATAEVARRLGVKIETAEK